MKILGFQIGGINKKSASIPISSRYNVSLPAASRKVPIQDVYSGWVFACIQAISGEVANIKFNLSKKNNDGSVEIIKDHRLLTLLHNVNDFFTFFTLFERLQANLEFYGNEYWYIERKNNGKGEPFEIYPLQPNSIKPVRPNDGKEYVIGYEYSIENKINVIPKENIIHFKNFNPFSDIDGLSTIACARLNIETDVFTREYNRRFFLNDATPHGALVFPDSLGPDEAQRLLDKWNDRYSGARNAFKTAALTGGLDYKQFDTTHTDMQYIEQSKQNRDDILAMFRVPKTVIGVVEDVNFASAKTADYVFSKRCILPKMQRIVDTLNEFYVPMFGDDSLELSFVSPVRDDVVELTTSNATKFANGQLTINEWRKQDGLPPIIDGDVVFMPFNLSPYGAPEPQKQIQSVVTSKDVIKKELETIIKKELNKTNSCDHEHKKVQKKRQLQSRMPTDKFEALGEKLTNMQRKREDPYIKKMANAMTFLFGEQKQEALKNIAKYLGTKSIKGKVPDMFNKATAIKATIDLVTPILKEFMMREGANALKLLGISPNDLEAGTVSIGEQLKKNTLKLATEVTQTTLDSISQDIIDGLENEEGIAGISSRIETSTAFSSQRSELIALTEVHRASGDAELAAWKDSGVVVSKIWYTAQDERVCIECDAMNGTEVGLDEEFASASDLQDMGFGNYDSGVDITELHPRCRCTAIPVVK